MYDDEQIVLTEENELSGPDLDKKLNEIEKELRAKGLSGDQLHKALVDWCRYLS